MKVLLDSSVVARKLLGEKDSLAQWDEIEQAFASRLILVELGRLIDRLRLSGRIDDAAVVALHERVRGVLDSVELVGLNESVLLQAAGPMPTVLGTLDAIHLATALELRRRSKLEVRVATHDLQLGRAARALGFEVIGVGRL